MPVRANSQGYMAHPEGATMADDEVKIDGHRLLVVAQEARKLLQQIAGKDVHVVLFAVEPVDAGSDNVAGHVSMASSLPRDITQKIIAGWLEHRDPEEIKTPLQ
jgi:hypothetical protein